MTNIIIYDIITVYFKKKGNKKMKKLDFNKTLDLCFEAWKMAQLDNSYKVVVFEPILEGEEISEDKISIVTNNTYFEDIFLEIDNQGFDNLDSEINWEEIELDELEEKLGYKIENLEELEENKKLTEKEKEIIKEWKNEIIENLLKYYWNEGDLEPAKREYKEIIRDYAKENNLDII